MATRLLIPNALKVILVGGDTADPVNLIRLWLEQLGPEGRQYFQETFRPKPLRSCGRTAIGDGARAAIAVGSQLRR